MGHKNYPCMKLNTKECLVDLQVEQCNCIFLMRKSSNFWIRVNIKTLVSIN